MIPLNSGGSVNPYSDAHELSDALSRGEVEKAVSMVPDRYASEYPLHAACSAGDLAAVQSFLGSTPSGINGKDLLGWSPLHAAAYSGRVAVVEEMIRREAPLDATDASQGFTPLHLAVQQGHVDVATLLARAGAPISQADSRGITPLLQASLLESSLPSRSGIADALRRGEQDAIHAAGTLGFVRTRRAVDSALPASIVRRDRDTLDGLLKQANIDMRDRGLSFFDCLKEYGIPRGLLAGTGASLTKSEQFTCMRGMIEVGDVQGWAFFPLIGCDPRTTGAGGNTLMHHAADYGRPQFVDLLVKAGLGDLINAQNDRWQTPLDIAKAAKRIDAATEEVLYRHGGRTAEDKPKTFRGRLTHSAGGNSG